MTLKTRLCSTLRSWLGSYSLAVLIVTVTVAEISLAFMGAGPTSSREQNLRLVAESVDANRTQSEGDIIGGGDLRTGKRLFKKHCATCHGPQGKGDGARIIGAKVADLSSPSSQRKLDVDLLKTIHDGRPGKAMPSWKWRLSEQQAKDVLAYIRTLGK